MLPAKTGRLGSREQPRWLKAGRWEPFCDFDGGGVQLRDIAADPEEQANLAGRNAEAAARLGISDSAVRGLVHRAREKILRALVQDAAETRQRVR